MIVTLTMNPSIDRTIILDTMKIGETNRVQAVYTDPSGKGINVSRVLYKLGVSSVAMGFLAGSEGQFMEESLQERGLQTRFTWLNEGKTRTNLKLYEVANNRTTEINEQGPNVTEQDLARLWADLKEVLSQCKLLICSGSLPPGVDSKFYFELITYCQKEKIKVCLDTSGPALLEGIQAKPYFIKPNQDEAETLLNRSLQGRTDLKKALEDLKILEIPVIVLSLGAKGALFYKKGEPTIWAKAQAKKVKSTAGCGDSLVASLSTSLLQEAPWETAVTHAIATSTATVEMEGTSFPSQRQIAAVLPRVVLEEV